MINWRKKLSSRKFWAAVAGLAAALLVLLSVDELTAERIVALISAEGALVAYIFAESSIDKSALSEKSEVESDGGK